VSREQGIRLFGRSEVLAIGVAVGDQHVQELARLVTGAAGIDVTGDLGQPGLDRRCQAAMSLNDPETAGFVVGDLQRYPHAGLRD